MVSEKREMAGSSKIQRILRSKEFMVFLVLVCLFLIMSFASEYFLRSRNLFNLLRNMSTIAVVGIGMTMVLVTAGVDLSVGSLVAVTSMLIARIMWMGVNPVFAILIGFAFGVFLGMINGFLIAKIKVPPFIATLGMMSIARGITFFLATGIKGTVACNISVDCGFIKWLGGGYVGPVPVPVIIMVLLVVIFQWFLNNTMLGRQIYALGSNRKAARLAGVNVVWVEMFVYMLTGGLCVIAGMMTAGLLSTAATNAGMGLELDVVAAVVIGGASLSGGSGTIVGAVLGAGVMAILKNAFVLLRLPTYMQTITLGVVVILGVAVDYLRSHGKE